MSVYSKICVFVASLCLISTLQANSDYIGMHALQGTTTHELVNDENDHKYYIHIRYPEGEHENLPVVYLLDGGLTYPLLSTYQHTLEILDDLPPVIVVGVSYKGAAFPDNHRSNDYTAPSSEREYWGGASTFVEFLKSDVFPLVETKSDSPKRLLFGNSLAGQFGIYVAQRHPGLFYGVIASNPALHRNLSYFLRDQQSLPSPDSITNLIITRAEHDAPVYMKPMNGWVEFWQGKKPAHWRYTVINIDGHGHISAIPEAYFRGMKALLRK